MHPVVLDRLGGDHQEKSIVKGRNLTTIWRTGNIYRRKRIMISFRKDQAAQKKTTAHTVRRVSMQIRSLSNRPSTDAQTKMTSTTILQFMPVRRTRGVLISRSRPRFQMSSKRVGDKPSVPKVRPRFAPAGKLAKSTQTRAASARRRCCRTALLPPIWTRSTRRAAQSCRPPAQAAT